MLVLELRDCFGVAMRLSHTSRPLIPCVLLAGPGLKTWWESGRDSGDLFYIYTRDGLSVDLDRLQRNMKYCTITVFLYACRNAGVG